jgi:hypothetical protein
MRPAGSFGQLGGTFDAIGPLVVVMVLCSEAAVMDWVEPPCPLPPVPIKKNSSASFGEGKFLDNLY